MTQTGIRGLQRIAIVAAVVLGCVGCDQTTKTLAKIKPSSMTAKIGRITLVGGLLGMLAYTLRSREPSLSSLVGLALVFAGGISNFTDRLVHGGQVVDFLNLGLGPLRTGIFNVADVAIVAGTLLLCRGPLRLAPPCAAQEDRDTPPHGE